VKYSFDNYEKHPSWAKHYGTIVTISINSPDEALLSSVNGLVPGIFDPKEGFLVGKDWYLQLFLITIPEIYNKKSMIMLTMLC